MGTIPETANLYAFKNVRNLQTNVRSFNNLSFKQQGTWSNNECLESLELDVYDCQHLNKKQGPPDIEKFVQRQRLIMDENVRSLTFFRFTSKYLLDLLFKYSNIEQLCLCDARDSKSLT